MNTESIYVVKADGSRELFDQSKLEHSLKLAGAGTRSVEEIIAHLKEHLDQDITTHEIYKRAFDLLHSTEKPVAIKYKINVSNVFSGLTFPKRLNTLKRNK